MLYVITYCSNNVYNNKKPTKQHGQTTIYLILLVLIKLTIWIITDKLETKPGQTRTQQRKTHNITVTQQQIYISHDNNYLITNYYNHKRRESKYDNDECIYAEEVQTTKEQILNYNADTYHDTYHDNNHLSTNYDNRKRIELKYGNDGYLYAEEV